MKAGADPADALLKFLHNLACPDQIGSQVTRHAPVAVVTGSDDRQAGPRVSRQPGSPELLPRRARPCGVWIILALVGLLYVDQAALSGTWQAVVRFGLAAAPILAPLGFFLSVGSPRAERPNRMIILVYVARLSLAIAAVTLGIGLPRA